MERLLPVLALLALGALWLLSPELRRATPDWLVVLALALVALAAFLWPAAKDAARRPTLAEQEEAIAEALAEDAAKAKEERRLALVAAGYDDAEAERLLAEETANPTTPEAARRSSGPRRLAASLLGVLAACALAVVVWLAFFAAPSWSDLDPAERRRGEAVITQVASTLADKQVMVSCDERGDYVKRVFRGGELVFIEGVAEVGGRRAYLAPSVCLQLYRLGVHDEIDSRAELANALATLAHEAWHLRGVASEAKAECYGLQSIEETGQALGLGEAEARDLARYYEAAVYSTRRPDDYVSVECRDGGALDLRPQTATWP